jgi:hypothetical protein
MVFGNILKKMLAVELARLIIVESEFAVLEARKY